jgi:hypothetical protein
MNRRNKEFQSSSRITSSSFSVALKACTQTKMILSDQKYAKRENATTTKPARQLKP